MNRKLIVTLVASALELYAAHAGAQVAGQCNLVGAATTASAATPVRTGPLSPVTGFPEYVTDSTGLSVQRCLDPVVCFADPVVATDPFSIQIGSGVEAFYWGAGGVVNNAAGNVVLKLDMAAETAFLQVGPNGEPINGSQFPFLRLRFTMGVPVDGTYTVVHPFGTDQFKVTGATGTRDVFATVDKGLAPNATVQGPVGPFLRWDPQFATAPVGFLGDGGVAAVAQPVIGSPCGFNGVQVTGEDTNGDPVDFGTGEFSLFVDTFTVQGMIFDGRTQTPVSPTRTSYSRTLAGAGQIDSFAASTASATVTVKDGPTIPVGTSRIPAAVTMDRTALSATSGIDLASVAVANPAALPPILSVTATDPNAVDPVTLLPRPTDPTTLNVHLVDFVDISQADFDPATGVLAVAATSGDARTPPTLTLRDFGTFTAGNPLKLVTTVAPPGTVTVDSAAGGSASTSVRVITSTAPLAPSGVALVGATATSVTLSWVDNSVNESGFRIYTVAANGTRTQVASTAANVRSVTVTGLAVATSFNFQVEAFNGSGAASTASFPASTLALPVVPSAVVASLGTASRTIAVSWADNSADETGFEIQRSTTVNGVYIVVGSAPAVAGTGTRSFLDTGGALLTGNGASYFYRVVALRGADRSAVAQSAGLTTPTAAQSVTGLAATSPSATRITLNWANRAGATTNQIFRSVNGGAFTLLTSVGAGVITFNDDTVAAPNNYRYHVDATNWAGATPSVNTAALVPVAATVLLAPTSLAATTVTRPVLTWVDASTGETNYRASRTPITVNTNGSVTAGATTVISSAIAANATTFTETVNQTNNNTVRYDVSALNGATVGTAASVYTAITGLPQANQPTATRVNGVAQVNLTWTALATATVGGYEIQRCVSTGVNSTTCAATSPFVKVTGSAINTAGTVDGRATASFSDTATSGVARTTNYVYRMRTVGGAGTGLLGGTFSASRAVSTN